MIKHIPTMNDTIQQWQETPDYRHVKREKLAVWTTLALLAVIVVGAVFGMLGHV